jgi:hypothetical protein
MKKLLTLTAVVVCVASVVVSAAAAGTRQAARGKTVTVAMRDPGCHWFLVKGKYLKTLRVSGPISLLNLDEASIKIAGRAGVKVERVGHKLALGHGTYRITMVGQEPDDNHLLLVIR